MPTFCIHCVKSFPVRIFLVRIFRHSDWMRTRNTDQKNSEYENFLHSDCFNAFQQSETNPNDWGRELLRLLTFTDIIKGFYNFIINIVASKELRYGLIPTPSIWIYVFLFKLEKNVMLPIATDILPLQFFLQLLIIATFYFLFTKFKLEKNVVLPFATDIVPLQFFCSYSSLQLFTYCSQNVSFQVILTLYAPIPQNGHTHSNNSSAICQWIVWMCLTILWVWRLKD